MWIIDMHVLIRNEELGMRNGGGGAQILEAPQL